VVPLSQTLLELFRVVDVEFATRFHEIVLQQGQEAVVDRREQMMKHVIAVRNQFGQQIAVDVATIANGVQLTRTQSDPKANSSPAR